METKDLDSNIDAIANDAKQMSANAHEALDVGADKAAAVAVSAGNKVEDVAKKTEHRLQEAVQKMSHMATELATKVIHSAQETAQKVSRKAEHRRKERAKRKAIVGR